MAHTHSPPNDFVSFFFKHMNRVLEKDTPLLILHISLFCRQIDVFRKILNYVEGFESLFLCAVSLSSLALKLSLRRKYDKELCLMLDFRIYYYILQYFCFLFFSKKQSKLDANQNSICFHSFSFHADLQPHTIKLPMY